MWQLRTLKRRCSGETTPFQGHDVPSWEAQRSRFPLVEAPRSLKAALNVHQYDVRSIVVNHQVPIHAGSSNPGASDVPLRPWRSC